MDFDPSDYGGDIGSYKADHMDQYLNQGSDSKEGVDYKGPWKLGCMTLVEQNGKRILVQE